MRRFVRENSLSLVFLTFFVLAVVGQAFAGWHDFNDQATAHSESTISFARYLASSNFGNALLENWQSEYLQFTLYILLTVWFLQRGSPESKSLDQAGRESDEEQKVGAHAGPDSPAWAGAGGWRTAVFSNSLLLVMGSIWVLTWLAQSVTGRIAYNADQLDHREAALSWFAYLGSSDFWNRTLQNWQSEFLAVGSMAVLSIYLRQRGSPESKPVGAPHTSTGVEG
jgi:hypothetical protein